MIYISIHDDESNSIIAKHTWQSLEGLKQFIYLSRIQTMITMTKFTWRNKKSAICIKCTGKQNYDRND